MNHVGAPCWGNILVQDLIVELHSGNQQCISSIQNVFSPNAISTSSFVPLQTIQSSRDTLSDIISIERSYAGSGRLWRFLWWLISGRIEPV